MFLFKKMDVSEPLIELHTIHTIKRLRSNTESETSKIINVHKLDIVDIENKV